MDDQTLSIVIFVGVALVAFMLFRKLMSLLIFAAIGLALYQLFIA